MKKVDLDTAATFYGISQDAVRKRIKRGKVDAIRESGRWYVFIPDNESENTGQKQDNSGQLVQQLKSENEFLRQQLHQQSVIIYNLSESVKLLKAPKREPWWRKLFKREGGS